jgi:hypothetical protein
LTEEGRNNRRLEKTAYCGASYVVLFAQYNQIDQVKEDEMGRICSIYGEGRNAYMILVEKPETRRSLR